MIERFPEEIKKRAKEKGWSDAEKIARIFSNLLSEIKPGDLVIACEGRTVRGICSVHEFTSYFFDCDGHFSGVEPTKYGRDKFEYSNILYPVKWFNWDHLKIDPPSIRAQGVSGINKCGICNIEVYDVFPK